MQAGTILSRKKCTGRLFFAPVGSPMVDLGNVLLVKQDAKVNRSQIKSNHGGRARVIHEEPSDVDWRWSVKLDEYTGPALALLHLAQPPAATLTGQIQVMANNQWINGFANNAQVYIGCGGTVSFTIAAGYIVHYVYNPTTGMINIASFQGSAPGPGNVYLNYTVVPPIQSDGAAITELMDPSTVIPAGTQFVIELNAASVQLGTQSGPYGGWNYSFAYDPDTGLLTITQPIDTSITGDGDGGFDPLVLYLNCPPLAAFPYTVLSESFVRGSARICLFDQNEEADPLPITAPREIALISSAELTPTAWPEDDGQKWSSYTLELLALTPPVVQNRD